MSGHPGFALLLIPFSSFTKDIAMVSFCLQSSLDGQMKAVHSVLFIE